MATIWSSGAGGAPSLVVLLSSAFAVLWLAWLVLKPRTRGAKLPPGPRGLPLLGNLPFLQPALHSYFMDLARIYGPVFKLQLGGKAGIVVSSPAAARALLKDHDLIFANHDVVVAGRVAGFGGSDIVWSPYGPEWRMLRKVCVLKMLSSARLDSFYDLRRGELRRTVRYLYGQAGSPVNLGDQIFLTVVNVATCMICGGSLEGDKASLGVEFRQLVSGMIELVGMPNISDFYPALARFDLQGIERKMKALVEKLDNIFERFIHLNLNAHPHDDTTKASDSKPKGLLQFLLELKDEEDPKTPLTMNNVKGLLMDMMVGGTDTSSNTVDFAMAEMMNKPETMRKAQAELDSVVGKDRTVEEAHIRRLPYLQAVMKETLRLHPTLPLLVPRCPTQNCTLKGYLIPKGARVFFNAWAVHRDPSIWENPLEFCPDRFLNAQLDFTGTDFTYFPFGSGRRICVGVAMAERTVLHSLATFLHSFDWKLPAQGHNVDLSEKFGIVLKLNTPLTAIPIPRLSHPRLYE